MAPRKPTSKVRDLAKKPIDSKKASSVKGGATYTPPRKLS